MKSNLSIEVVVHARKNLPAACRKTLEKSALTTLTFLPKKVCASMTRGVSKGIISIAIVGPKEIQSLNSQYRKKNKPTDVLSFSRMEDGAFLLPTPETDLGDVLICWSIAKKQAKEYGTSLQEELSRLTVHGVLHLFGYDHEKTEKEAKKMFTLQDKVLREIHSSRGIRHPKSANSIP